MTDPRGSAPDARSASDVLVVGAGAAGLAAAIFAARAAPRLRVRCLDGARHLGAKILVSGGSRCNVTNRVVEAHDFRGGSTRAVRAVLKAFPAARAADWFASLGVALHEEADGKLFPDTNRARTVLDALLEEARRRGVSVHPGCRVCDVRVAGSGFAIEDASGDIWRAAAVVLATGGRSLPKTGSDGFGYELARRLGHGLVETTPALVPLVLEPTGLEALAGVSHPAALTLRAGGRVAARVEGSMLWTHVGISGPAALDLSRHWHRARLAGSSVEVHVNVCPGETEESLDLWLRDEGSIRPRTRVERALAGRLPAAVAAAWLHAAGVAPETTLAHLTKDARRRLVRALTDTVLAVRDSRGYAYAEATAGGVPLDEIDPATMASRVCPGLYLVGEILDVDGRLGGFNFQWAWSSAWVAGHGIARALDGRRR